ncbi:MAG: hypothetical protein F6J97_22880 [Leptolyngbya sp. SIO4C1]|nr:hypothetical protein [Leptolyngbya sp. SIO4C1]
MEDWIAQLENTVNAAADEAERWLTSTLDTVLEASEQAVDRFEKNVDQVLDEFEQGFEQSFEPWAASVAGNLMSWMEETAAPVTQVVDPWLQDHPRCVGCRNYHGQSYGRDTLICAMHPYGPDPDLERCPDWEAVWPH